MGKNTTKTFLNYFAGIFLAFLFITLSPHKAEASHMMSSDISWKCVGPFKFEVALKLYRDCRGISISGSESMSIVCDKGGGSASISFPNSTIRDVTPNCATAKACNPPNTMSGMGIEEHTFIATIDFNVGALKQMVDDGCCLFKMSFQECCRNGAITTGADNENYFSDAEINICNIKKSIIDDCDNSPDLRNPPIGFLCCNQEFYFNNGVVDTDGDSLAFSLVMSQSGSGVSVTYNAPYDPVTWPMTGYCRAKSPCPCRPGSTKRMTEGICFDPETGDMSFNPVDCDEVGIICIKIEQFRLDENAEEWLYIGYTKRDLQLWVVSCGNNNPPKLKDLEKATICEGDEICVIVEAEDEEYMGSTGAQPWKDTIDLTWNNGLPGATFDVGDPYFVFDNGITFAKREVEICWQTKVGDGREAPYLFTVTARDKACPRNAVTSRGYSIKVKRTAYAERFLSEGDCGKWTLRSEPEDTFWFKGTYTHNWEIRDSTNSGIPIFRSTRQEDSLQFLSGGKYIISYMINNPPWNCPYQYLDTIVVPELLTAITPADTFICIGDSVTVPLEIKYGTPPYKIQWENPLGTADPADSLLYLEVTTKKSISVAANIIDANNCTASDTTFVLAVPNPEPDIGPDQRICTYDTVFLKSNYPEVSDNNWKFHWSRSPINKDSAHSIWLNTPGWVYHKVIDTIGCWGMDSMQVFVNKKVIADAGGDKYICIRSPYPINNDTLEFVANRTPTEFPATFLWTQLVETGSGRAFVSSDSSFFKSYPNEDSIFYELYITVTEEGVTCVDADTINIKILPLPVITFSPMDPQCFDFGRINLKSGVGPNAKPDWLQFSHKKEGIITNRQFFETDSFPKGTKEFVRADGQDKFGCYNIDSFQVVINPNPTIELDSGLFCQNADYGDWLQAPDDRWLAKIPLMQQNGVIKRISTGADYNWKILDAPNLIPKSSYESLIVQFGPNQLNKALDVGPVKDKSKLGWYTLQLCATNVITGCQSCDTVHIEIIELPEIEFTKIPNQCVNFDTLDLNKYVNLKNGKWFTKSGPANYQDWVYDSAYFLPFKGPGFFDLKYEHTATGCYVADSTTINVSALPVVRPDTFSRVCNTDDIIKLTTRIPGAGGSWTGFGVSGTTDNYTFNPGSSPAGKQYEGPYMLAYSYTHPVTGCTNGDSFAVTVQTHPEIEILNNKPYQLCEFDTFNLKVDMKFANSITWTHDGDGQFSDNKSLEPIYVHGVADTTTGEVLVKVETDALGVCPQEEDEIQLLIRPYPQIEFEGDPLQGCQPLIVNFNSTVLKPTDGDVTYYWELDSQIRTSSDANPANIIYEDAGDFNVKLVVTNNKAGCETELMKEEYVNVYPNPIADFSTSPTYFTTVAIPRFRTKNLSQIEFGEMFYLWDFGTENENDTSTKKSPEFMYDQDTGSYLIKLLVTSDKGCVDSAEQWVEIGPDVTVYIPNAFSPDEIGPHKNNRFYVFAQGIIDFDVKVFNRWGEKLYESKDLYEGWDGKFQGVDCKQDVYTYLVKVTGFDEKKYEYKGTVTLLR